MTIKRTCGICNKVFYPLTAQVNCGKGRFCSKECRYENQSNVMRGRKKSLATCKKLSKALKGRIRSQSHSKNISKGLIGKYVGNLNGNWRGGMYESQGRFYIRATNHPNKHSNGYILYSHYVAEKALNRYLTHKEHIHHINFQKDDDRPENLYIFATEASHTTYHQLLKANQVKPITESNLSSYQGTSG